MSHALIDLAIFASKSLIILLVILAILVTFFVLLAKGKDKLKGHLTIKNLNDKYREVTHELLEVILPKKLFKQFLKEEKTKDKKEHAKNEKPKAVYIIDFNGDIKASAVNSLREEVTAILNIATPNDEVVVRLESPGGMVNAYGLAAS